MTYTNNITVFRTTEHDDTPKLKHIWETCFGPDTDFMNLFFSHFREISTPYILERDGSVVSALYVIPVNFSGHRGGYIYGVGTHPEHRGHRYAIDLISHTEKVYLKTHSDFLILRPASPTLFGYYRKIGYITDISRAEKTVTLPSLFCKTHNLRVLSPERLIHHRSRNISENSFIWNENLSRYHILYIQHCMGNSFETFDGTHYFMAYPEPENNSNIICEESDMTINNAGLLADCIKSVFPDAKTFTFIYTSKQAKPYLLCKTAGIKPESDSFFNFTME